MFEESFSALIEANTIASPNARLKVCLDHRFLSDVYSACTGLKALDEFLSGHFKVYNTQYAGVAQRSVCCRVAMLTYVVKILS